MPVVESNGNNKKTNCANQERRQGMINRKLSLASCPGNVLTQDGDEIQIIYEEGDEIQSVTSLRKWLVILTTIYVAEKSRISVWLQGTTIS